MQDYKPTTIISDLKFKRLVFNIKKNKNTLLLGHSGTGKTVTALSLKEIFTDRKFFNFSLGSTSNAKSYLLGNLQYNDNKTQFNRSEFINAIQTENSIILLDELSRAHKEAWNILLPILDENQNFVILDEELNTPKINVANNVTFIATANVGKEYTATQIMDKALMDRFHIIEIDSLDKENELNLLNKRFENEFNNKIVDIIFKIKTICYSDNPNIYTIPTTRWSLNLAELCCNDFTLQEALDVELLPKFNNVGNDNERQVVKMIVNSMI